MDTALRALLGSMALLLPIRSAGATLPEQAGFGWAYDMEQALCGSEPPSSDVQVVGLTPGPYSEKDTFQSSSPSCRSYASASLQDGWGRLGVFPVAQVEVQAVIWATGWEPYDARRLEGGGGPPRAERGACC